MKRFVRYISLILAILLLVSIIPLKAVADEMTPFDSVENPEDGVVIYHNKDGSYTMVVGVAADGEKTRGAKGSSATSAKEVQVQIEKQFQEGSPLATLEYAGGSLSFFPILPKVKDNMLSGEQPLETEETGSMNTASGELDLFPCSDADVADATGADAASEETVNESISSNKAEDEGYQLSDTVKEPDPASISEQNSIQETDAHTAEDTSASDSDDNEASDTQDEAKIVYFVIPRDKEGNPLPLAEMTVFANTDETELVFPEHLEALDSEGVRKSVLIAEWKVYRGTYGDEQREWVFFPSIDAQKELLTPALLEVIDRDAFSALPHVVVRWSEDGPSARESEDDHAVSDQLEDAAASDTEVDDSEDTDPTVQEINTGAASDSGADADMTGNDPQLSANEVDSELPETSQSDETTKTTLETEPEEGTIQAEAPQLDFDEIDQEDPDIAPLGKSEDEAPETKQEKDVSISEDQPTDADESDPKENADDSSITELYTDVSYSVSRSIPGIQVLSSRKKAGFVSDPWRGGTVSEGGDNDPGPTVIRGEPQGSDSIVYKDLFGEGVDLCLYTTATGIKEVVRIGAYTPDAVYRYTLRMDGLTPVQKGQEIALYMDNVQVGRIQAPYMTDEAGAYSSDISVSLYGKGDGVFELVYVPDDGWLASESRAYPIKLDPTIEFTGSTTLHMEDNYVSRGEPSRNFTYNATEVLAGGVNTAYIRPVYVDALSTTSPVLIKSAALNLYCKKGSGTLRLHQVQGTWNSRTITYNSAPSYGNTISTKSVSQGKVTWDITEPFSSWFHSLDQAGSFGVALEGTGPVTFSSADTPNNRMTYSVTYYLLDEANTLTASTQKDQDDAGYVDLSWAAIPHASGYYVGIYNGRAYEYVYVGNITSWSTKGKGLWPTPAEIANGRYQLHLDGTGTDLPLSPAKTYQNAGTTSLAYSFDVRPANAYKQAANTDFKRSVIFPEALGPEQPTSVQVSPSTWTNAQTIQVSWSGVIDHLADGTVLTMLEEGGRIQFSVDGITNWLDTGSRESSGTYALNVSTLADGTHTVYIRGLDKDGNAGAPLGAAFLLDKTAPTAPQLSLNPAEWTIDREVIVTWSDIIEQASGIDVVAYRIDDGEWTETAKTEASGSIALQAETLSEGTHSIEMRATDKAGNVGEAGTAQIGRDVTPPTLETLTVIPSVWSDADEVEFSWTGLMDTGSGLQSYTYTLNAEEPIALAISEPEGTEVLDVHTLPDGQHTAVFRYIDTAGNAAEQTVYVYRDTTLPEARILQPADGDFVNGIVNVTGTAKDAMAMDAWELMATGENGNTVTVASGSENRDTALLGVLDTGVFADGEEVTLALQVKDRAGHTQMATGIVIKVDKSMKDLAGEITLLAPTQGEILIDPVYRGQYENGSENGWVYVDGTKTAEADGRTFAFPAIRYEEDSSHTISVISVNTDEQLSYSKGLALLVIGSNAEGTDTSYTSDELVAPKNILALRLTSSESEAGSIEYGYSCDNKETWNQIEPDRDVRLDGSAKSVWLKAEPKDGAVLYGWALSAVIEKEPVLSTVQLKREAEPLLIIEEEVLTEAPDQNIETDAPTELAFKRLYANGILVNEEDFTYETLRTEEQRQVKLAVLGLTESGIVYASGNAQSEVLLRQIVSSDGLFVQTEALQKPEEEEEISDSIYAIRLLAETASEGCTFYVSIDETNWIGIEPDTYLFLPDASDTVYCRAEQTELGQLMAWHIEGVSAGERRFTVQLMQPPRGVVAKDYGKHANRRVELSWSAPDNADADTTYVVYKNSTVYAIVTTTSFTDSAYTENASYAVSAKKTFEKPGEASYMRYLQRESEQAQASRVVIQPPAQTPVHNELIDFADEQTRRALYGGTYLFTNDMLEPPAGPTLNQKLLGRNKYCSLGFEPVNFNTGNFFLEATDYTQADIGQTLSIQRTYNTQSTMEDGPFGEKWTFPYGQYLEMYTSGAIGYRNASGALTVFTPNEAGGFTGNDEDHLVFTEDRARGEYTVRKKDGTRTVFEKNSGWLIRIEDRNGNAIQLHRKKTGFMDAIEMASGAKLLVTTDERGHVTQIHLPDGSDLRYTYEGKRLTSFTDQNGYITRYEYDEKGRMTAWRDGLGVYQVQNTYDEKDRVTFQKDGLNGDYKLEYHDDNTIVTDALGNTSEIWFDSLHRTIREVNALDSTIEYFYDEANNLVGTTDADGKLLSSVYDERGNQLKNILPDGSMGTKTYDKDDNLLSYTDANGNTISYTYDAHGNLLTATDALENVTSYAYNERGQVTSVKDALGGMTVYRYQGANVVQVTSANRSVTAYAYDTAGRLVRTTDPMGNVISYAYDACGNVLSVRLPNGAQTRYAYDAVRNCVLMTDALGNETRYKYDALRHLTAILYADGTRESTAYDLGGNAVEQIDALGNATKMAYDPVGNLIAVTDAEGNRTEYAYDKQNRLVCETLPTGATRTYTYDPNSGLVTKTKDERGSTTELTYDAVGNVLTSTRKNGAKQTTEYDALNRVIRQTDANGGVTSYKYDALGRVTEETNALGGVTAYAYDPVGNLIEVTDALGNTTRAKYDPRNQLLSVTDPLGATTAYTYDAVGNLTSVTDPLRNRTTYRYDLAGNLNDMIDALGLRQSYAYDSRGRVVTTKQKDGGTTAIAYDAVGNVVQLTDALGSVTRFAYNPFGQTTEVTDALGQKAKMLYDALGNMTRVTSPDGSFTLYTYDPAGQLLSAVDPAGDKKAFAYDDEGNLIRTSENGNETSYRYDPAGNILGMTDAEGRAAGFLYDAMGNLTKTIYPDRTEAVNEYDVLGRIVRTTPRHGVERAYAYDAAGQVTEVHEGERVTKYAYDLSGNLIRVTAPDGSETAYRYDALNRPVRVIDALGNETTYGYDAMDRLVSARQPNGATIRLAYDTVGNLLSETDALGAKQTFAYDALGRLQEVTDALGHRTAYGYDALDNLTLVRDANGNETRYKYDSLSRLRSETDALGNTTQYEYTPEGWLKETKRPDGTTLSYDYDRTGRLLKESASDGTEIRHDFDAMGQLTEIEDETGTTKLRYDERGLLIGVENPLGDVVQYEYNQYAEKTGLIYPDGKRAEYAYDSMSRLLSVTEPNGTTTAYTYDALGRRTRTSDSTLTTEYGYDAVGNLVRQANENVTLTYRYDLNNRMTEEARTEGGTTLRSGFAYDKAGQLTSFRRSDGYAEAYTYDPVGNMVEKVLNGTKIAMTYDAANELKTMESSQGKLTYAYDLNGNLTQKTLGDRTDTYSYDARNRLKQYRGYDNYQVKYSYSALGMLHARESSGAHSRTTLEELIAGKEEGDDPGGDDGSHITTYTYDLTQPYYQVLTETTDGATTAYTYGLERLAAYTENTRTAYLYDGRGSVIQTRGSLGTQTMAYSAYGELLTEKVSGYGYNGEYYDAATGMLNLRARQYEPAQGRFSQRDSLKGWAASPRSMNAYLYCLNDAINFFDASGAAMMAVNMTDGGGGRSTAMRVTDVATSIATAVKQITAATVTKEANTHALTQAQVSSILKEKNNPASVLQQARANRTKALENTSAVSGSKNTACMSQEEYDNFWTKLFNILFPSSCAPKSTTTPQPTSTPVPPHEVIEVRIPKPSITPGPTPAPTPQPTSTSTPDYKTQKIKEFSAYVYKEVENHSFYVWGGYGQSIYRFKNEEEAEQYLTDKTKEWGKRARQSRNVPLEEYDDNLEAVLTHYRDAKENGYDAHMFDCSGLYSAWGIENGFFEKKHNVAQLKKLCDLSIPYDQIQEGDWVFKPGHIGYVIGFTDSNEPIIGQAEGHVPGLTIRPYSETGEWEIRRPNYEKIFGGGN